MREAPADIPSLNSQVSALLQHAYLLSHFVKQNRSETMRCLAAFQFR